MYFQVDGLEIDAVNAPEDIDSRVGDIFCKRSSLDRKLISKSVIKSKSIDSRRSLPKLIYSLLLQSDTDLTALKTPCVITAISQEAFNAKVFPELNFPLNNNCDMPIIIVGTGPAGIFAALALARSKFRVIVLDRGKRVDERSADHEKFISSRQLDEESNLLIGEGGAGTFSDGKLFTRTKDEYSSFILKTFVEHGASPDTMYLKRPHIGSDVLPRIAASMRHEIESLGGEFRFSTNVKSLLKEANKVCGVVTSGGEKIYGRAVLIAHGLGGRSLTMELIRQGVRHELKGFQIGCRIEHPQLMIDKMQYHLPHRPRSLGSAEYNFVSPADKQKALNGVSTFCMCPGGEVVMASAWRGQLTSNGMSLHARSGRFANSCLIMSVDPAGFKDASVAYDFLCKYETAAFEAGGGDYTLPAQSAAGFLSGREELIYHETSCRTNIRSARLDLIFPDDMRKALRRALLNFQKRCPFFIDHGQFVGFESCVSSPVRFIRDEFSRMSSIDDLYLAGEGAGYAGGIMSGAIDGLRTAAKIAEKYTN